MEGMRPTRRPAAVGPCAVRQYGFGRRSSQDTTYDASPPCDRPQHASPYLSFNQRRRWLNTRGAGYHRLPHTGTIGEGQRPVRAAKTQLHTLLLQRRLMLGELPFKRTHRMVEDQTMRF
jgi:hypothetical protein